jgi:putative ABC transport system permease protein
MSVALLTLALAIGANTAIFSLVDVLVFRDLPVREPGRLVEFVWQYPGDPPMNAFSVENYDTFRTQNTVFSDLIGTGRPQTPLRAVGETLVGDYVTGNLFSALGVRAAWGRLIGVQDDQPDATPVAVVSWTCWRDQFNLDPGILGRAISVGGIPATVVGVADRRFVGLVVGYKTDVWIPAAAYPARRGFMLVGRLKDGVSLAQAQAEMRVLDRPRIDALAERDPAWRTVTLDVRSARAGMTTPLHAQFAKPLVVLLGIVGALLVLACANIGSLLLARAAVRRREMAIRLALGASRLRIIRHILIESVLLAIAGSVLGIVGAYFGGAFLARVMSSGTSLIGTPPHLASTIDGRVLLFTIAATALAAVLFGLAPAWAAFASTPGITLKEGAGTGQTRSRRLFGNGLVVAQVALSLVLLSVSDLYVVHLSALRDRDLGFSRKSVLLVSVDVAHTGMKPEQLHALYPDLLARLQAIPGVVSAAVSAITPLSGAGWSQFVTVEGVHGAPETRRRMSINSVAPKYFATLGTPLIGGRDFRIADANGPRVAIVNQAMARHYFASGDPIGKLISLEGAVAAVRDRWARGRRQVQRRPWFCAADAVSGLCARVGAANGVLTANESAAHADRGRRPPRDRRGAVGRAREGHDHAGRSG